MEMTRAHSQCTFWGSYLTQYSPAGQEQSGGLLGTSTEVTAMHMLIQE